LRVFFNTIKIHFFIYITVLIIKHGKDAINRVSTTVHLHIINKKPYTILVQGYFFHFTSSASCPTFNHLAKVNNKSLRRFTYCFTGSGISCFSDSSISLLSALRQIARA